MGLAKWNKAVTQARKALGARGVARKGTRLYAKAIEIFTSRHFIFFVLDVLLPKVLPKDKNLTLIYNFLMVVAIVLFVAGR